MSVEYQITAVDEHEFKKWLEKYPQFGLRYDMGEIDDELYELAYLELENLNRLESSKIKNLEALHTFYGIEIADFNEKPNLILNDIYKVFSKVYWSSDGKGITNTLNLSKEDLEGHQIELSLSQISVNKILESIESLDLSELETLSDNPFADYNSSIEELISHWINVFKFCKKKSLSLVIFVFA